MKKIIISIITFILCILPVNIFNSLTSVNANEAPKIRMEVDDEVKTESNNYCYVYLDNIEELASLEIQFYYDANDIEIKSLYNYAKTDLFDYNINNDVVNITYIFNKDVSFNNHIFSLRYEVKDTTASSTYFDLAIIEALDKNLNNVNITGQNKKINIIKKDQTYESIIFNVDQNAQEAKYGDLINLKYYSYYLSSLASGSFVISYDKEYFELVNFELLDYFNENILVDINIEQKGFVYVSFITLNNSYNYNLFQLNLKVISNININTSIKLSPSSLYGFNNEQYISNEILSNYNLIINNEALSDPYMYIIGNEDKTNKKFRLTIRIEENSFLGAADFILKFPNNLMNYKSYSIDYIKTNNEYFIVNSNECNNGIIKFSIISLNDITIETDLLTFEFDIVNLYENINCMFDLSGSNIVDSLTNSITIKYLDLETTLHENEHSFSSWSIIDKPTCVSKGKEERSCSNCGYFETREIEAHGHNYVSVVTDPTCIEQGYTTHTCETCGDSYKDAYIEATGHSYGDWYVVKEPSCIEKGLEQRDCSCGHSETRETEAHGHNYVSEVTDPTCIEQGYTTHTCETCGDSYKDTYIEATGHSYGDWYVVNEPSCIEKGLEQRDCSCGHSETRETEAHGHNYVSVVTDPTCIEQGYTTHTCETCGDSYKDTYIEATGHSYGDWYVVKEPSCIEKGLEQRDCSCGHSETRETEAHGHNYVSVVTAPTCIEQGYTTHTCETCGDSYKDTYIEATGHSYGDWYVVNEPSCVEKGLEQRDCSCGHSETREIEATGHDLIHHEGKDATCEEAGYKAYEECSKCNYSTYEEIEAHGHNYEWVDSDKTTDEGKPMEDYKCEHCGHIKDTREKGNKELIVVGVIFGGILLIACYFIFKPKY